MALHFMRDYAHQRLLQRCVGMGVEKPRGNARRRRRGRLWVRVGAGRMTRPKESWTMVTSGLGSEMTVCVGEACSAVEHDCCVTARG